MLLVGEIAQPIGLQDLVKVSAVRVVRNPGGFFQPVSHQQVTRPASPVGAISSSRLAQLRYKRLGAAAFLLADKTYAKAGDKKALKPKKAADRQKNRQKKRPLLEGSK